MNIHSNCNENNTTSNNHKHIQQFFRKQMHKFYKFVEIAQKI